MFYKIKVSKNCSTWGSHGGEHKPSSCLASLCKLSSNMNTDKFEALLLP
jgi:hypothetical protein